MAAKQKPARVARGTGFEFAPCSAAGDGSKISLSAHVCTPHLAVLVAARDLVDEAVACGARFIPTARDFLWEPAPGANRSRIRKIIADAKAGPAGEWHAFVAAVREYAKGGS